MAPLLEVRGLCVSFMANRGAREVLSGVDLAVGDGEIVGLVGESGSGKSILLSAILGLLSHPWEILSGTVKLRGRDLLTLGEADLTALREPGRGHRVVHGDEARIHLHRSAAAARHQQHHGCSRPSARARRDPRPRPAP